MSTKSPIEIVFLCSKFTNVIFLVKNWSENFVLIEEAFDLIQRLFDLYFIVKIYINNIIF